MSKATHTEAGSSSTERVTPSTTLKRHNERTITDLKLRNAILDEAVLCHISTNINGYPAIIPTTFVRIYDAIYIHGSRKNRLLTHARSQPTCVNVTILDSLVFAPLSFNHSMNFRSVVAYGIPSEVENAREKTDSLDLLIDRFESGRSKKLRPISKKEIDSTIVLKLNLDNCSVKARSGPPGSFDGEYPLNTFVGTVDIANQRKTANPVPNSTSNDITLPVALWLDQVKFL